MIFEVPTMEQVHARLLARADNEERLAARSREIGLPQFEDFHLAQAAELREAAGRDYLTEMPASPDSLIADRKHLMGQRAFWLLSAGAAVVITAALVLL